MRTATIHLAGKDRLLCFSTRVVRNCTERYGGIEHIGAALSTEDTVKALDESMWLLSQMLEAGARYARMNGMDNPEPLDADGLYDCCDISDFAGLRGKIIETISNGQKATVEAEAPKNAGAAQGER